MSKTFNLFIFTIFILLSSCHENSVLNDMPADDYDIVIYGGTSAAITAAVQAARMGNSVVIVCPDKHLGGLSSGGLGFTDTGDKSVIGGLSREFYHRIWKHYNDPEAWKWQKKSDYGNKGQGTPAIDGENRTMWIFEPHAAEQVFEDFVKEYNIPVYRNEYLDRKKGVKKRSGSITSITMLSGKTYRGKVFIDATYEGDLLAAAGVSYIVGREGNAKYGESLNGVQTKQARYHQLKPGVDPYIIKGSPQSGILPGIDPDGPGKEGHPDHRIQAYNFRMCLTNVKQNRVPFAKPQAYDEFQYELLFRNFECGEKDIPWLVGPVPNNKTDTNNRLGVSTDFIGQNYKYPEADYDSRRQIIQKHELWQKGLMWTLANHHRVPEHLRSQVSQWGLAKDEFPDNGHWPHQLYIREARRMVSDFVMTELHCRRQKTGPRPIGKGSYTMDSHHTRRYIAKSQDGSTFVQNEGDVEVHGGVAYSIDYGAIVPKLNQCRNLLVPVCISASHIAYGSIRMEPVFMILGQSAATAAAIAIEDNVPVQNVDYQKLKAQLLKDKQILQKE